MITSIPITIDLNSVYSAKIKLPQNELGGRTLYFTLTSSGVMVDLTDKIVVLSGEKPDGTVLFLPCVVTNATYGMANCAITDQFVSTVGEIMLQIRIYSAAISGTATSATSLSLYDTTQAFTPNLYAGKWIYIVSGSGSGQSRLIASNTATQIVVTEAWSVNPSAGSIYSVVSEVGNSFPFFATVIKSVDIDTQVESSSDFSALQTAISTAAGLDAAALHKTGDETKTGGLEITKGIFATGFDAPAVFGGTVTLDSAPTSALHAATKAYVDSDWTPILETWAYASATTITVPTGAVSRYQKFDKIKYTQNSTVKYGRILSVSDTVITLIPSGVYAVANTTISNISISRKATPFGFPGIRAWMHSFALASNVLPQGSTYYVINDNNTLSMSIFFAAIGSYIANTQIVFTLPAGFRPSVQLTEPAAYQLAGQSVRHPCDLQINTNGEAKIYYPLAETTVQYLFANITILL